MTTKRREQRVYAVMIPSSVVVLAVLVWWLAPVGKLPDPPAKPYIDMHAHAAGIGEDDSGAFISAALRDSYKFPIYLRAFRVKKSELAAEGDEVVLRKLNTLIAESRFVDRAVVLAMDGVITDAGELDRDLTQIYVPNDYLIEVLPKYPHLMFGASVNPMRPDALARLEKVVDAGAVLNKWIPNIMAINPSDARFTEFYRRMAELKLPLLTHTGPEHAFGEADDELGTPDLLHLPLSLGVTVIASHIAAGNGLDDDAGFVELIGMFDTYPNLYADISALTQINKLGYLKRALEKPTTRSRLLYGTDWPLQFFPVVSPYYHVRNVGVRKARAINRVDNPWDRDVLLKMAMGTSEPILRRAETVLRMPQKPSAEL